MEALDSARENGLGFYESTTGKISVGVRPDYFLFYVFNAFELHREGEYIVNELQTIVEGHQLDEEEQQQLSEARHRVLRELRQYVRDASFHKDVCEAYGYRCAVTGTQLNLIDAAHILPVAAGGPDEVSNGICLSPTMHRAFDSGLIYLDENHVMRLNQEKREEFEDRDIAGGFEQMEKQIGDQIHLPDDEEDWPDPKFIQQSNHHRQIG